MKNFMLVFKTFPWLNDPALIVVLAAVGCCLRFGACLADDFLESIKILFDRFKRKS